jgi:predicted Zn-dependent peptidase
MLLRGSTNSTKSQITEDLENLGARLHTETGREISRYTL